MSEQKSQAIARIGAAAGGLSVPMLEKLAEKLEFTAALFTTAAQAQEGDKEPKGGKAS